MTHPIYWDAQDPHAESLFRPAYEALHHGGGAIAATPSFPIPPEPVEKDMGYWMPSISGHLPGGIGVDIGPGGVGVNVGGVNVGFRVPPRLPPASLPPARVPPRLPPIVGGGGMPRIPGGRGFTRRGFPRWSRQAALYAGAVVLGKWVFDQAGNLLGEIPPRRMNVLNPRALSRSMRRVTGFSKFCRKAISFTKTHRMKKGFRKRRK